MNIVDQRIADLHDKYTVEEIRQGFITGTLDKDLAKIGEPVRGQNAPEHILVWTGYELAIDSKYQPSRLY